MFSISVETLSELDLLHLSLFALALALALFKSFFAIYPLSFRIPRSCHSLISSPFLLQVDPDITRLKHSLPPPPCPLGTVHSF